MKGLGFKKTLILTAILGVVMLAQTPRTASAQTPANVPTLNLYTWSDYIDPALITKFEAQCHCKLVETDYDSNSEMMAKLRLGGDAQYDVVVPTGFVVREMADEGLIQPVDHSKLSNFSNLIPRFQNPAYDPGDKYSIPYQWGTTGLVYDPAKLKTPPQSWSLLFDPAVNTNYPFVLPKGEGRNEISAACAYLGYGFNCMQPSEWTAAAKLIKATRHRPNFSGFVDETPALSQMKNKLIALSIGFNGDVGNCHADGSCPTLQYFIPKEGSDMWVDTMAITAHAKQPALALAFINFILDAKNGADLSNFNQYASPNAAARPMLQPILLTPMFAPSGAEQDRLIFLSPLTGEKLKLFNAIWTSATE